MIDLTSFFLVYAVAALKVDTVSVQRHRYKNGAPNRRSRRQPRRFSHKSHDRLLTRQLVDECWNIPGSNITQQTLGPSYDAGSLYNSVLFESVISGQPSTDDERNDTLPINQLANALLEGILLLDDSYDFEQENEYFGRDGEFTKEMLTQHQLLVNFWQVTNDPPILLVGVHSEMLQPEGNLEMAVAILAYINGYQDDVIVTDKIRIVAAQARLAVETELPNGYSNNDLTAQDGYFMARFGVINFEDSSVIIAGDGALYFDVALGHGDVGSDIFHAHEFAHALQHIIELDDVNGDFDLYLDMYDQNLSPETSRYFELEADAMAAYALAHKQGRNFPISLLLEATKSAFAIGDCSYDSVDHHGSPKQRECATKWGAMKGWICLVSLLHHVNSVTYFCRVTKRFLPWIAQFVY